MKRTSIQKIITIFLIALLVISFSSISLATGTLNPDRVVAADGNATQKVYNVAGVVLGVAQAIGVSVAVIMLVVIAIKYITASAEGKAEVKKYAVGYIIGAILLFAGVAVLRIIQEFAITI